VLPRARRQIARERRDDTKDLMPAPGFFLKEGGIHLALPLLLKVAGEVMTPRKDHDCQEKRGKTKAAEGGKGCKAKGKKKVFSITIPCYQKEGVEGSSKIGGYEERRGVLKPAFLEFTSQKGKRNRRSILRQFKNGFHLSRTSVTFLELLERPGKNRGRIGQGDQDICNQRDNHALDGILILTKKRNKR